MHPEVMKTCCRVPAYNVKQQVMHKLYLDLLQCTHMAQGLARSIVYGSGPNANVAHDLHLLQSKAIANAHARSIAKR